MGAVNSNLSSSSLIGSEDHGFLDRQALHQIYETRNEFKHMNAYCALLLNHGYFPKVQPTTRPLKKLPPYSPTKLYTYMKGYLLRLVPLLQKKKQREFVRGFIDATSFILGKHKDFQFFTGGTLQGGTLIFVDCKDGVTDPIFYFFAHGMRPTFSEVEDNDGDTDEAENTDDEETLVETPVFFSAVSFVPSLYVDMLSGRNKNNLLKDLIKLEGSSFPSIRTLNCSLEEVKRVA